MGRLSPVSQTAAPDQSVLPPSWFNKLVVRSPIVIFCVTFMAAKYGFWKVHRAYVSSSVLLCVVGASFMVLQRVCLNNTTDAFVDDYCLSDSNMRTVIAFYLSVFSALPSFMVTTAFDAFRVGQLKYGICEGVYIALATSSPLKYKRKTFFLGGKWAALICVVMFLYTIPNALQTVTNPFIYTNSVFVRNKSIARVVPSIQSYDTPEFDATLNQLAQEGASAFQVEKQLTFLNFESAFAVLLQVRAFSAGDSSTKSRNGNVTTNVVRYSYLDSTVVIDGDLSNALRQQDTLATVNTQCSITTGVTSRLADLQTPSSQYFNVTALPEDSGESVNITVLFITNFDFLGNTSNAVMLKATSFLGECAECQPLLASQDVSGNLTTCTSTITFTNQEFIYTVGTGGVMPVRTLDTPTTVAPYTAGILITAYAASADNSVNLFPPNSQFVNALLTQYLAYPQGLFEDRIPNLMHNKMCSAASQTLGQLWTLALGASSNPDSTALLSDVPLYNIVLLTHISTRTAAITVGVLITFAVLVCAFGMVCAHQSPINIKTATEDAFIASVDDDYITHKRRGGASNDPDLQIDCAFAGVTQLYCRAIQSHVNPNPHSAPNKPNRMILTHNKVGVVPDKQMDYV